jgi:glucose-6-phosphate isomerase
MKQYKDLDQLPVFPELTQLARKPFDLTAAGALSSARIASHAAETAGFRLLYSTQRLTAEVLAGLQQLADQSGAVEQFVAMKQGSVMNRIAGFPSEERMVLHTAVRDVFSGKPEHPEATAQAAAELKKMQLFLAALDSGEVSSGHGPFTDMVMVGIGGSDLGPRALYLALENCRIAGRRVHFISNVDPDDAARVLKEMDLSRTLVNVVSKSGTTLETLTNEELVRNAFTAAGL